VGRLGVLQGPRGHENRQAFAGRLARGSGCQCKPQLPQPDSLLILSVWVPSQFKVLPCYGLDPTCPLRSIC
jgi:hypothetical protein